MLVDDDVLIDAGTGIGDLGLDDLDRIRRDYSGHAVMVQAIGELPTIPGVEAMASMFSTALT